MKKIGLGILLACFSLVAGAQDFSLYEKKLFVRGKDTMPYRMLFPENYNPKKSYPIVFFLHGAGEKGSDNETQLVHGSKLFLLDSIRKKYPAIVVFPQCSPQSFWSNVKFKSDPVTKKRSFEFIAGGEPTVAMSMLMDLTKGLIKHYAVKKKQVYVMGLSMGGMGAFEIAGRMPGLYAAAVPICGGGSTLTAKALKKTGWWVFHGGKDDVVSPAYSDSMVAALKTVGAEVKYTLYPDANHNSWDAAFAEPGLLHWLFSHKK